MAHLTAHATSVLDAFNDSQWDEVKTLIGNSTYDEVGTQRTLEGDEIIEALKGWKAAMPDAKGTVTSAVESGNQVALEVIWTGTQTGEMVTDQGTIPASGKSQTTRGAFVYEYDDQGNLKESRNYFDLLTFLRQIDAA